MSQRRITITYFTVKTAFSGASLGDVISRTYTVDTTGLTSKTVDNTLWRNESTGVDLATAPSLSNLSVAAPTTGGLTDAQLRASPVPVAPNVTRGTGAVDANTQRVTLATDGPGVAALGSPSDTPATSDTGSFSILAFIKRGMQNWTTLLARVPVLVSGRVPTEPLGIPGVARQQTTTTASANVSLTANVARISLYARSSALRYSVGANSQTANASTSHYLASGERIDIDVPVPTANIAVIRASDATADGAAEITELS